MNRQGGLLTSSFVCLAAWMSQEAGCFTASAVSGGTDSGGGGASSSSGGVSDSGGPDGDGGQCTPDPTTVIDDMSGASAANATGGYWYTYSDRTVPNSEPPIVLVLADGGAPPGPTTPPEGQSFPVTDAGAVDGCRWGFREAVGGGEKTWGAGFGMDFLSYPPDGAEVSFNECEAGAIFDVTAVDAGTVGIVQPFDASAWTGISFWAISFTGAAQVVWVQMDDDRTSPWGGICNACNSAAGTVMPCSDSFRHSETFQPVWTQFKVAFDDMALTPQGWSMSGVKAPVDKSKLYNLHFQVTSTTTKAFDLGVAMVQFYR